MEELEKRLIALEKEVADLKVELEDQPKETQFYLQQLVSVLAGYTLQTRGSVNKQLAFRRLDGEGNIVTESYMIEANKPFDISIVNKEGLHVVSISSIINFEAFMNHSKNS